MAVQIVLDEKPAPLCGGLPPVVRGLHRAAAELAGSRVVVDQDSVLALKYPVQTAQARLDAGALKPASPLLALAADGFAAEGALAALTAAGRPAVALFDGRPVAAYLPEAGELAFKTPSEAARAALLSREGAVTAAWTPSRTPEEARAAEDALCAGLAKPTDGYLARLDRRLSIALSRRLLPFDSITPNAVTTASLALGLLGSWWLATGEQGWQLAGAFLLWFCCILDGCDGELARLKLLSSPEGAAYDLWADQFSHLATFVAVPVAVYRARPDLELLLPGALLVTGFLGCMFSVWRLVLSRPESERGPHALLVERLASRDYVYLIAALVAVGRLEWFLWAAGAGSHVFYAALWALELRLRAKPLPSS